MIWKGTYWSIEGPTFEIARQCKNQAIKSMELSIELRDNIVLRHRSGEGYQNISAALKVPKNTVASNNGRRLEPPRLFLELTAQPN
jgi:hypothetical protein